MPTGAAHPASSSRSTARSQSAVISASASVMAAISAATGESARTSTARAPWPAEVGQLSASKRSVIRSVRPMRVRPASASTIASYSPSSTLRSRVSTLPRMPRTCRSGRRRRSWATRRGDPLPTTAPCGSASSVRPSRAHSTSATGARGGTAPIARPATSAVGRSFIECTTRSHSSRSSASRSAATNTPVPPSCARGPVSTSPAVVIGTSSTSRPVAARRASATWPDCVVASRLARVPSRSGAGAAASVTVTARSPRVPAGSRVACSRSIRDGTRRTRVRGPSRARGRPRRCRSAARP